MKKVLQKIIIWIYWKLNCHTKDSYAAEMCLYVLPYKMQKQDMTVFVGELNRMIKQADPLRSSAWGTFPDKIIHNFES